MSVQTIFATLEPVLPPIGIDERYWWLIEKEAVGKASDEEVAELDRLMAAKEAANG